LICSDVSIKYVKCELYLHVMKKRENIWKYY